MSPEFGNSPAGPALRVRTPDSERSLAAGRSYFIGRDPQADIVVNDSRVSWRHAVLRLDGSSWLLEDVGSTNGTFQGSNRVQRLSISSTCAVRLGHPNDGPALSCEVAAAPAGVRQPRTGTRGRHSPGAATPRLRRDRHRLTRPSRACPAADSAAAGAAATAGRHPVSPCSPTSTGCRAPCSSFRPSSSRPRWRRSAAPPTTTWSSTTCRSPGTTPSCAGISAAAS